MSTNAYGLVYPHLPGRIAGAPTLDTTLNINGSSGEATVVFRAPKSGNISKIYFRTINVVTGCTLSVRLETVNLSTGFSSGTLKAAGSLASVVIADTDDSMPIEVFLDTPTAVLEKEYLAVRFTVLSGTPTNLVIASFTDGSFFYEPYCINTTAAQLGVAPIVALMYDDGSWPFILGIYPMQDIISATFNNSSSPNFMANKFQLQFPCVAKGTCIWFDGDADATVCLLDSDGQTILASGYSYVNVPPSATAGPNQVEFESNVNIQPNKDYYLSINPTTASSITMYGFQNTSSGINNALFLPNCFASNATNPLTTGAWVDNTSGTYFMSLVISELIQSSGSSPTSSQSFHAFVN